MTTSLYTSRSRVPRASHFRSGRETRLPSITLVKQPTRPPPDFRSRLCKKALGGIAPLLLPHCGCNLADSTLRIVAEPVRLIRHHIRFRFSAASRGSTAVSKGPESVRPAVGSVEAAPAGVPGASGGGARQRAAQRRVRRAAREGPRAFEGALPPNVRRPRADGGPVAALGALSAPALNPVVSQVEPSPDEYRQFV